MTTTTPTNGAADLPEALRKAAESLPMLRTATTVHEDGRTWIHHSHITILLDAVEVAAAALAAGQATAQAAPQQEAQEPVGYTHASWIAEAKRGGGGSFVGRKNAAFDVPIYTAPPHSPAAQGDALDAAFEAVRKRLCKLPRYSFALDSRSNLRRCEDKSGNWIEFDSVHALFDPVAIDAARAAQEGGWMPIETAPKDSGYLLLRGGREQDVASGYWLQAAYAGNGAWIWPFVHMTPRFWAHLPPTSAEGVEHGL